VTLYSFHCAAFGLVSSVVFGFARPFCGVGYLRQNSDGAVRACSQLRLALPAPEPVEVTVVLTDALLAFQGHVTGGLGEDVLLMTGGSLFRRLIRDSVSNGRGIPDRMFSGLDAVMGQNLQRYQFLKRWFDLFPSLAFAGRRNYPTGPGFLGGWLYGLRSTCLVSRTATPQAHVSNVPFAVSPPLFRTLRLTRAPFGSTTVTWCGRLLPRCSLPPGTDMDTHGSARSW